MNARRFGLLIFCWALVWPEPALAEAPKFRKGDLVRFAGQVTGQAGTAVADLTVVLELSRTSFRLLKLRRQKGPESLRLTTRTATDGRFQIDWQWDGFYNTFEIVAAVPVSRDGREDFELFKRIDVTSQVSRGNPVNVPVVLDSLEYVEWFRRFLKGEASPDEDRVFRDQGRPDRVDGEESTDGKLISWWYFEAGKVYRFRGGELQEVTPFEPVKSP